MIPIETVSPRNAPALAQFVSDRLQRTRRVPLDGPMPSVTLSYAQSLDGSIAAERGKPLKLSNPESQRLTHQLRAWHDAVLVGINTVLSDDPQLTVRLASGKSPQPVVLDSSLRFPLSARLLHAPCVSPIIVTTTDACAHREWQLREAGAQIVRLPPRHDGRIGIRDLLTRLHALAIGSLMVEGGAEIITSFLASEMVDQLVITIIPQVLGGLPAVTPFSAGSQSAARCGLTNVRYHSFGGDLVVFADVDPVITRLEDNASTIDVGAEFIRSAMN